MISFTGIPAFGLRLGNFMFNVAAMRAAALRAGTSCMLPPYFGVKYLEFFNLPDVKVGTERGKRFYQEPSFTHTPIPVESDLDLYGYFQSEKHFLDFEKEIRDGFQFNLEFLRPGIVVIGDELAEKDSCFIHVRRTDYLGLTHIHTNLGATDYYKHAVEAIKGPETEFFIFSDDPDWCTEYFKFLPGARVIHGRDIEDLFLMTRCSKGIIANSSFSWWGAWLGKEKQVIAPKNWFQNGTSIADLIPECWALL